jgi:hypothetical protein
MTQIPNLFSPFSKGGKGDFIKSIEFLPSTFDILRSLDHVFSVIRFHLRVAAGFIPAFKGLNPPAADKCRFNHSIKENLFTYECPD